MLEGTALAQWLKRMNERSSMQRRSVPSRSALLPDFRITSRRRQIVARTRASDLRRGEQSQRLPTVPKVCILLACADKVR
jgi:hypothetical protein